MTYHIHSICSVELHCKHSQQLGIPQWFLCLWFHIIKIQINRTIPLIIVECDHHCTIPQRFSLLGYSSVHLILGCYFSIQSKLRIYIFKDIIVTYVFCTFCLKVVISRSNPSTVIYTTMAYPLVPPLPPLVAP